MVALSTVWLLGVKEYKVLQVRYGGSRARKVTGDLVGCSRVFSFNTVKVSRASIVSKYSYLLLRVQLILAHSLQFSYSR